MATKPTTAKAKSKAAPGGKPTPSGATLTKKKGYRASASIPMEKVYVFGRIQGHKTIEGITWPWPDPHPTLSSRAAKAADDNAMTTVLPKVMAIAGASKDFAQCVVVSDKGPKPPALKVAPLSEASSYDDLELRKGFNVLQWQKYHAKVKEGSTHTTIREWNKLAHETRAMSKKVD